ncbi:hypothetical protein TNCV_3419411 [Trichonephila clavipes]|nr:hypothetical protein TNCV_3419411 [Trichonephila clavipes]
MTTAQHYAATDKDYFAPKSVGYCYVAVMKVSSTFFPGEDSTRIIISGTFRVIIEKNRPSFLWCPRLMLSVHNIQYFKLNAIKGTHQTGRRA